MLSRVFGSPPQVFQQAALSDPGLPPEWLARLADMSTKGEPNKFSEYTEQGFRHA